jgi:hypothetical protein
VLRGISIVYGSSADMPLSRLLGASELSETTSSWLGRSRVSDNDVEIDSSWWRKKLLL